MHMLISLFSHPTLLTDRKATQDDWSSSAADMAKMINDGPTVAPAEAMIDALNNVSPLSNATAIMDSGCGTGLATGLLIERYGSQLPLSCRIIAADFSSGVVEEVNKRREQELSSGNKLWGKVETALHDAQDLSGISNDSISHMMAGFMFFMVANPQRALTEALRVLQPKGVLVLTSWVGSEWMDLFDLLTKVRADVKPPKMGPVWSSVEGVTGQLQVAGFQNVEVRTMTTYMRINDPAATVDYFIRKMPHMAKLREAMTEEEVDRACALMVEHLEEKFPKLPGYLAGTAIVGIGSK